VHKKARSHSAVLLLLAPVLAIGSSFLVAGSANATTAKSVSPTITICKSVSGSFHFTLNGKSVSLSKSCTTVAAKVGSNTVVETSAPASYRNLAAISVSPNSDRVSASLKSASAVVKLAAKGAARVLFTNAKVVTQVVSQQGTLQAADGFIEICKYGADPYVAGTFSYTISEAGASVGTASVAVNSCSGAISVPASTAVTVTETAESPYYLYSVGAAPLLSLVSTNLPGGSAVFVVTANEETTASFTNATALNWIKVCKTLTNNEGSLAGSTFSYAISWTFTPPTGASAITESGTASLTAVAAPGQVCVVPFDNTWATGIPVGATVTVTENAFADVSVSGVAIVPSTYDAATSTTPASTAVLTVPPVADGYADAVFTNDPLGVVEVCKNFDPWQYNAKNSATFTVTDGAISDTVTVNGGECSAPIWVPAGAATVSEASDTGFYLESVSTESASDPMGTRLLTSDTTNPAVVSVPYGGVGDETVVTFTNAVDPTQFKICKQETSADAALSGATFDFSWTFSFTDVDLATADFDGGYDSTSLTIAPVTPTDPTGLVCSRLFDGPPSILPDGGTASITITEGTTSLPGVEADGYSYQGNGSVIAAGTADFPVVVSSPGATTPASVEFTPGAGINIITFTNGSTGDAGYPAG